MPKGLMGCIVSLFYLAKFKLTMNSAVLPSGRDSLLVLYLCDHTLYEQGWTKGEALARLVLLPEIWTSTVTEPNIPSKGGKVWVKNQ